MFLVFYDFYQYNILRKKRKGKSMTLSVTAYAVTERAFDHGMLTLAAARTGSVS